MGEGRCRLSATPAFVTDPWGISVREVTPVVLEDEPDGGQDHRAHPDDHHPPPDDDAEAGGRRGHRREHRPPAVRAEEAQLAGALGDLALLVVLRARTDPAPGEQE